MGSKKPTFWHILLRARVLAHVNRRSSSSAVGLRVDAMLRGLRRQGCGPSNVILISHSPGLRRADRPRPADSAQRAAHSGLWEIR